MDQQKPNRIDKIDLENDYLKLNKNNKNPFPIEVLEKEIQEIIFEIYNVYGFNIDYLGAGILTAASASIGKAYQLKVKPTWIVKANLFTVIIGRPGDGKTPALNFCYKPISDEDDLYFLEYDKLMDEYEKFLKNKTDGTEEITKPYLKKNLINDFTPEALVLAHSYNKNGLYIKVDELVSWLKNFNRYNNSGEAETYLSLWSGEPISKDRASTRSMRINDSFIGVIGGIQIGVLKELAKGGRESNGFMDRFLFVYPERMEKIKWNNNIINENYITNYHAIISKLLNLKSENENSRVLIKIEKKAQEFINEWQNNNKTNDLFEYERGISVKLEDHVYRFSLILQLLSNATTGVKNNTDIQLKTIKGAIKLYEYFFLNAMKVRYQLTVNDYYETLTELQKKILGELDDKFTTQEGINIACKKVNGKARISERQFKTYLNDKKMFKRISRGNYEKIL
jgi:hypothetical protein